MLWSHDAHGVFTGPVRAKILQNRAGPHEPARFFFHRLLDPYRHRRTRGQKSVHLDKGYGILPGHHTETRCFLNHIICFCTSIVSMFCAARQNPVCATFIFIEEIVMEVSTTKRLICEDNDDRNYWNIFKYDIYYLVGHTQTHTHTHTHTHTRQFKCVT